MSCALVALEAVPARAGDGMAPPAFHGVPVFGPIRRSEAPGPPPSVVLLTGVIGRLRAYGCGVIIAERRDTVTILTAAHNLAIAAPELVTVAGERLHVRDAIAVDGHDLALVTADRPRGAFEVARYSPHPAIGARVHLWGPVHDVPFTPQEAVIRPIDERVTDTVEGAFAMECSACAHGDSGTGVFDERDRLVGIVTKAYFANDRRLFVMGEGYRPNAMVAPLVP
ncbi:MAG: hypothetical protein PVSMB8_10720 [Vulcanimicrobiaceae bacterium]